MKRMLAWLPVLWLLTGCTQAESELDRALRLRETLENASCVFSVNITADYGDKLHVFAMECKADAHGNCTFTVTQPSTICGITGTIDAEGGKLTFDDAALFFPLLAEGQISPVSAPWVLLRALRGGYLRAANREGEYIRVSVNDTYEEDALQLDIWLDAQDMPSRADISYAGYTIVSLTIENFEIG